MQASLGFTRAWMQATDRPTAVLCYNDEQVATLQVAATGLGLELPRDLSIVVFAAKRVMPVDLAVDYVCIDSQAIGSAAVAMLGAMVGGRGTQPNRAIAMPYVAVASTAPPRL
jgi:DNA-binding LacI/PurR family transcriptional regulator